MTLSSLEPTRYVMLSPHLPCTLRREDGHESAGAVHALSTDRLLVTLPSLPSGSLLTSSDATISLTVRFDAERFYTFVVQPTKHDADSLECTANAPEDKARLVDLLGLVRKGQHITLCATQDVEASDRYTGFSDIALRPKALPEMAWDDVDTSTTFLGRKIPYPILITGMTGGITQGAEINRRLALAAQHFGIPMGVGSQRVALENPSHAPIFAVKTYAPNLFLIGNVGIAQIRSRHATQDCQRAVHMIGADALAIHVNVLQEVVQVEGDRDFRDIFRSIEKVVRHLDVPVMIKEVGCGIDVETAKRLAEIGVAAIDCGGKGGTSWSLIEGARAKSPVTQSIGQTFRDWGIPTALSVALVRKALPHMPLVATGGMRDGLMVAKAMALGATVCGIGLPIFKAALDSDEGPFSVLETFTKGLKTAMLCSGTAQISGLKHRLVVKKNFQEALSDLEEQHILA